MCHVPARAICTDGSKLENNTDRAAIPEGTVFQNGYIIPRFLPFLSQNYPFLKIVDMIKGCPLHVLKIMIQYAVYSDASALLSCSQFSSRN